ncbi:hypothetical protein [Nocardia blacklockiae]|uniref:hypothetical protein n=1 Tax=Nocardia blacklockiae TaxID=480036 RepID=UPI001893B2A7|nr:hypothetical protein [Nocardia blacklockiae]MBF6171095.1 hypothetical protein [Nocardia blacklockiae]
MSDEQIGFDIDFDDKTQAFLEWAEPENMEAQVRAFLADTVPGIADYADEWWKHPLLLDILEASKQLFGDWEGFIARENSESADRFVRFIGECCIRRHPRMTWTKDTDYGLIPPLFGDFGPAVHDAATGDGASLKSIAEWLFDDDGPSMVEFSIQKAGKAI